MKKLFFILFTVSASATMAQNVGVGTTTATKAKLEVVGVAGAGNTNAIFGSNVNGISLQQNWPTIGFNQYRDNTVGNGRFMSTGYAAIQYMDPGGGGMYIDMLGTGAADALTTSGVRAIAIQNNGRVGIMETGSTASLTVARGVGTEGTALFRGTTNNSYFNNSTAENTFIRAGKSGGVVYLNDIANGITNVGGNNGAGRLGINIAAPDFALHIKENPDGFGSSTGIGILSQFGDEWELRNITTFFWLLNGTTKSSINPANGAWNALSDKRVKKNIHGMSPVLDKVMQLKPVQYEMISDPGAATQTGFIAQDVQKLFPELVTVAKDPNHRLGYKNIDDLHMMDYSGFGVIAIKAIQEQQQMIDAMDKRIRLLEEQNKLLMQQLNTVK